MHSGIRFLIHFNFFWNSDLILPATSLEFLYLEISIKIYFFQVTPAICFLPKLALNSLHAFWSYFWNSFGIIPKIQLEFAKYFSRNLAIQKKFIVNFSWHLFEIYHDCFFYSFSWDSSGDRSIWNWVEICSWCVSFGIPFEIYLTLFEKFTWNSSRSLFRIFLELSWNAS